MCYTRVTALDRHSRCIQSRVANARCNPGQTRYASMHTNSVSKQHARNYFTQTHGVWTRVYGNMYCFWRPFPAIIRIYLIFLETTNICLHFAADNIGLSSLKFLWCLFLQEWRFSRSRSSRVIDVGTNRKRVIVHNNNLILSYTISENLQLLCTPDPTPIPP